MVTLSMPDGKQYDIPLVSKTFSTGREGFYAQIPSMVYNNEVYGGQIQVWKKGVIKINKLFYIFPYITN